MNKDRQTCNGWKKAYLLYLPLFTGSDSTTYVIAVVCSAIECNLAANHKSLWWPLRPLYDTTRNYFEDCGGRPQVAHDMTHIIGVNREYTDYQKINRTNRTGTSTELNLVEVRQFLKQVKKWQNSTSFRKLSQYFNNITTISTQFFTDSYNFWKFRNFATSTEPKSSVEHFTPL